MRAFGFSDNPVNRGGGVKLVDRLFHGHEFVASAAALAGNVIVAYGVQLGHRHVVA